MKTPKLIQIDLSKGTDSDHPDIRKSHEYLVKIDGEYHAGYFTREWYGWNFYGGPWDAGYQFDTPGTNGSDWEGIWRIK